MSIAFNPNLTVVIEEYKGRIIFSPSPLENGFSKNKTYQVLGIYNASESSECLMMLANDRNEIWFISNRHLRFHSV